jgi:essential nuclear protein 1
MREANIVASVIAKSHVPVLHSAAALSRCCDIAGEQMLAGGRHDLEAAGATNLVIKVLLDKKYALPYQTIDALVFHFLRFRLAMQYMAQDSEMDGSRKRVEPKEDIKLPVIWHQSLLVFAQRYKNDIAEEQREALLDLLLVMGHHSIGPEIRRELLAGRGKGMLAEPAEGNGNGNFEEVVDGDDTLMA